MSICTMVLLLAICPQEHQNKNDVLTYATSNGFIN